MNLYFDHITEPLLIQICFILFLISFTVCVVIIVSSEYGFSRRAKGDELAVQSAHEGFVPRVGGLAIFISLMGLIPLLSYGFIPLAVIFEINASDITLLILSATPVFLVGLIEDLGYKMSPMTRIIASVVSGLFVLLLFQVWITKLGIPGVDSLLVFKPIAIIFTLFATVGVVNAFNLIDGLNGLSGYVSISTAVSLSVIAFQLGDLQSTFFFTLLVAAIFGFLVLNFPFGKIFLGDGGAYALGHLLVWSSILLIQKAEDISEFAILLIFFWPVADTGLAIWRRWKSGSPADQPDRLHFHQLAMRFLEIRFFGRKNRKFVNSLSTIILAPLISVPQILGVLFWNNFLATVLLTGCMAVIFTLTYLIVVSMAKCGRLPSD